MKDFIWIPLALVPAIMVAWFMLANYLSIVLHRCVAHRAVELPRWWIFTSTTLTNLFVLHINPRTWCADHRMHHAYSDTEKDPDKQPDVSYLQWLWGFFKHSPKASDPQIQRFTKDAIFKHPIFAFFSHPIAGPFCAVTAWLAPFAVTGSWIYATAVWIMIRITGMLVLSFQSYFAHGGDRGWGYRNYDIKDHSVNLTSRVALFLTAGEALQNNHHAKPSRASHAHLSHEWDPGFQLLRFLERVHVAQIPEKPPLAIVDSEAADGAHPY
ncbi:MAG: fatty acid desaturase [Myxococcales bacterium]|nr:fatty acid desaturase [Myxococcales bacterium]